MSKVVGCQYCGGAQLLDGNPCENCGASTSTAETNHLADEGIADAIAPVLEDSRRSRVYLTTTALVFALLAGIFWEQSRVVSTSFGDLENQPIRTGPGDGWRTRQIVLNASGDLMRLKSKVHNYFEYHAEFPETFEDLEMNPKRLLSRNVRNVSLGDNGVILASLTRRAGKDVKVKWIPEVGMDGTSFQWICTVNVPDYVMSYTTCETYQEIVY